MATIENRLRHIEDRLAIRELVALYNILLDDMRIAEFVDLWTSDGEFRVDGPDGVHVVTGRQALTELCERRGFGSVHVTTDLLIDLEGDTATSKCRVIIGVRARHRETSSSRWVTTGLYQDQLARTIHGWRFAARTFRPDARIEEPFPPVSSH